MTAKTLILSDLHLGNGGEYDIFAGGKELPALLDRYAQPGNTVILNGDSIDFLMNEDPLELEEPRAVEQIRNSLSCAGTAETLQALGRVLGAGGNVSILLGNHDIELALGPVQAEVRAALKQPAEVAARLRFERGHQPSILDVGGARILVTHGHHSDAWNRVNYPNLPGPDGPEDAEASEFVYSAGSRLVKTLANPLKRKFGMRFADLIKPDFQGGVLTALSVNPLAVRTVFQGSTLKLMWQLFKERKGPSTFDPSTDQQNLGLSSAIDGAGLSEEERKELAALLDPDKKGAKHFADGEDENPHLDSARKKLGRAGLRWYANAQRRLAGEEGKLFFAFEPANDEWTDAQRLSQKFHVGAVIFGHTHAARFKATDDLVYINTGTWIWLMSLPAIDSTDEEWTEFLETCRNNPKLDPAKGKSVPLITRFTGALIEENPQGGADLSLVEWKGDQMLIHGKQHVAPTKAAQ